LRAHSTSFSSRRLSADKLAQRTERGGVVVEALGVLHEKVDKQEEEHEGGRQQVERRKDPAGAEKRGRM
jgi:hypothetical protein